VGQTSYTRRVKVCIWTGEHLYTQQEEHTQPSPPSYPSTATVQQKRAHFREHWLPYACQYIPNFRTGRRRILGRRIDTPFWYQLVYCLIRAQGGEGFLLRFKQAVIVPITTFMVDQFLFNPSLP